MKSIIAFIVLAGTVFFALFKREKSKNDVLEDKLDDVNDDLEKHRKAAKSLSSIGQRRIIRDAKRARISEENETTMRAAIYAEDYNIFLDDLDELRNNDTRRD